MKTTLLILLISLSTLAKAQPHNTENGCYRAMNRTGKPVKAGDGANSTGAWDVLLEEQIKQAKLACNPEAKNYGDCLGQFVDDLRACEDLGGKSLRLAVKEIRQATLPHVTPTAKPVEMSEANPVKDAGGRKEKP